MHEQTARSLRDGFLNGSFSALEITNACLERIDRHDQNIHAFLHLYQDKAIKKAKHLDDKKSKGERLGKLAGVPIAVKDNIHVKGELSTCASKFLTNFKAPFDATVVSLLEEEDAVIIGKTNLDEFAMGSSTENSAIQATHNPWKKGYAPGGSSGGSAAAVAARFCPLALGSDTGGSIRQPAALCGVVGFKPTYGRVSRFGLVAFGSSLDQIGPFAANAGDAGMLMEVLGQHCPHDSTSLANPPDDYSEGIRSELKGVRVGVPWQFLEGLAEEPRKTFENNIESLKALGAEIVDVDLGILKYGIAAYYILATAEASTNLARFDGVRYGVRSADAKTLDEVYDLSKEEGFGPEVKRRIMLGTFVLSSGFQDAYYKKAQRVRYLMKEKYREAFQRCDIIATPVAPSEAFKIGSKKEPLEMYLEDIYTISINLAGVPAISVPAGFSGNGLPYGLQLIGPLMQDKKVVRIAGAFEQAHPEHTKIPPVEAL